MRSNIKTIERIGQLALVAVIAMSYFPWYVQDMYSWFYGLTSFADWYGDMSDYFISQIR